MIAASVRAGGDYLVLGAVRGLVADGPAVIAKLEGFAPKGIGVGLSFDEMTGLNDHFVHRPFEPLVPLTPHETAEVRGLSRHGEVRVPHPTYVGVLEWAADRSLPVEALEPSDDKYATLFTDHISYFELVRRTLRERKLARAPPESADADAYALTWDGTLSHGRGSRAFLLAREEAVAAGAQRLAARVGRTALVVDRERFDGVVRALSSEGVPTAE
ncbi:MAG: hypothetical protein L3K17_02495 [Thermoplasmata archaeon]|nr:hypothetical protein [Thermoplasmata archaeon]